MKKTIFLLTLIFTLTIVLMGCSTNSMQEPPEISITIGDKEIEYISAKNKWDGSIYDREDTFVTILKNQKDIPIIENGSIVEVAFQSNSPDEFKVFDILIDENGQQIYTDKEIKSIPVVLAGGKYVFNIETHFASSLSSYYESNKKDIRGFRMIASWGENESEYAFVIKSSTLNLNANYQIEIEVENYGTIYVELDSESAPITVNNFIKLAEEGFYDGLTFHRIISGFMIQGGDPLGNGTGGSDETIKGEFSENKVNNTLSHTRGAISMARSNDFNSARSQFFIVHEDSTFLDGSYAAFGYVTAGMDIVDKISSETPVQDKNGTVKNEDQPVIKSIKVIK